MAFSERVLKRKFKKNILLISFILVAILPVIAFNIIRIINNPVPRFVETPESSKYILEVSNENYKAKIGGKDGNTASVQFINPDKKDITFSYISQDKKKPTVESDSRKVTFKNVDKNIDIEYIPLTNGLKENIILTDKPKSNYYYFATDIKEAIVKKHYKGEGVPAFYTDKGEYLFNIEPGYAIDARGKRTDDIKIDVIKSEGKHYLRVKVDEKWLTSKNRAYPIKVDPTIVYDTSSEFANGVFNRARDTGSGANPVIETTYQELNTDPHTAGLWHMNESSGNIQDASGNGNIGTPTGTTVVTGIVSNARDFNGSSDFINLGNASILNITGDLSIEAWVKVDSYASGLAVVTWANGSYTLFPYHVAINTTGTLRFNSSTTGLFDSTGIVPLGVWSHIAITTEGKLLSFYINGELDTTHQLPSATRSAGDGYLSLSRASTQYFDGSIDEVRISDRARTKEEILQSYNKSAYSVYTSEVIDIGSDVVTWNNLTWTEQGVLTGSAETLSNTTSLVAQWNLNETSGITATNNAGSCGVSCNGTLTSFDSTASQDADPDSSWTSNQRRWGTGALMFDGVDSYVTIPDNNALSFGNAGTDTAFSISTWVYPRSITTTAGVGNWIINKRDGAAGDEYQLIFYEGKLWGGLFTGNANNIRKVSNRIFTPDRWYNIVMTYDGSKSVNGINLYVNGALEPSTASSAGTYTGMNNGTAAVTIGKAGWSNSLYFDGIIDSTFIVGRQMTANEIISNYQSSNLEIQTRVGDDATPNDGTWETWTPNTVETSLTAMDNQFLYPTNDSGQTLYWPLDETANNTCTGGVNDVCDKTGSNDAEVSGTTIRSGAYGKARGFPGNTITDFIYEPSYTAIPTTSISVEFWIKTRGNLDGIFSYASTAGDNDFLIYDSSNLQIFRNTTPLVSGVSVNDNQWHHVVATWRSSDGQTQIYKDGKLAYTGTTQTGTSITTGGVLMIGQEQDSIGGGLSAAQAFKGTIDEIKVFNTVLSASTVYTNYLLGSRDIAHTNRESDSIIKTEGSYSQEIKNTSIQNDSNTISAWSFEETSGTGAYIKDITGNNPMTPTGSSLTKGIIGNARTVTTSDNLSTTLNGFDATQNNITVSFWAKHTITSPVNTTFLAASPNDSANSFLIHFPWSNGFMYWDYGDIAGAGRLATAFDTSWYGEWAHWAFVSEQGVGQKIYRNGTLIASDSTAGTFSKESKTLTVPNSWQGIVDELEISGVARTQKEINDAYRQGSNAYINLPINSTNLTTERNLKLDIAADTSGQYLEALIGESAFANYQTDTNTVGLWHFDETIDSPEYLSDNSGTNNHSGNYTTASSEGRIGKGRYFNGLNEYLQTTNNYNFTSESFTISMWVKPSNLSNNPVIISNGSYQVGGYYMHLLSGGGVQFVTNQAGITQSTTSKAGMIKLGSWNHISIVRNGSSVRTYINGQDHTATAGTHVNPTSTTSPFIIGNYSSGTTYFYNGYLDELRVDRVARTAEEIRQAFNFDSRTYDIEIDFAAKLDNSNVINSIADTSFIVDATYHGAHQKGDNLYVGDKIIVRENVNGIRYMATGTVTSVTASTGSAGVSGWDAGSTFPPSGYTQNASLFKWQTEYWKIQETNLSSHLDAVSLITIRVTDGKIGRELWIDNIGSTGSYLTNPSGSTITSSTGNRYMQYRVIQNSNRRDLSSKLSLLSVDYTSNVAPNTPTLDSPSDVTASQPLRPVLRTTATDVDLDYMRYRIQLCEDIFMTRNCQTFDQTSSQTGWSGQNTQTNTAYTNGSQATYTLQSDLEEGKTYYWRSYAIDPAGMNQWSTTQSEPFAFAVNARPRPNQNVYKQHFIARRESSYPSSTTGWASINGAAESGTTGSPNGWIAGSNFTVGDRYLIMVWGSHQADNISAKSGLRVKYGSTPFTESQAIETSNQSATSYKTPYFWFTVWTAQNANLEVETYWSGNAGTESRVEDITLVAINAEDLIANGDLHYNISTTGGTLDTTYSPKASAAFTTTETAPWWIMGYSQADIVDLDSDKYQTRLNLISTVTFPVYNQTETPFGVTSISGKDAVDTPVYGTGYVQEIATGIDVDANIEIKESAANQQWAAAGVLALNLKAFDSYSYTTTTNNTTLNTPSAWVEQGQINPLNRYTSNYIIASGSVIDDAGTKTISRIQNSEANITDDVGGWRHNTGDIMPLTLADIYPNLTGGIKNIEMDSQSTLAGTSTVDDRWIVALSLEDPAIGPSLNTPAAGATNQSVRTQFKVVAHDPDSDSLMYKIDLCSNLAMTTDCQTFNQQSSQTGWTGQNAFSNQRYASGTEGTYTLQSDLNPNTTYYWRAYVIDPSGTNVFTAASAVRSFTTSQSPFQPSAIEIEASTNPTGVTDLTPEISALHTDPESDSANYIRIQVSTVSNFASTVWDTGKLIMTTTAHGVRTPALSYSGSTLYLNGQLYYVRIKLWDVKGAESAWSNTATFQMHKLEPANGCHITDTDPTDTTIIIKWNDNSALEDGYRVQRSVNGGAFANLITKPSNSTFHTDSISAGNTYRYRIATTHSSYFAADCTTSTADVKTGEIRIGGIKIGGIKID